MNLKYHFETNIEFIPKELTSDTKHVQQNLNGFLLAKEGISITKCQIFVCKICYVLKKYIYIPKLASQWLMDWHHTTNVTKIDNGGRNLNGTLLLLYHIN